MLDIARIASIPRYRITVYRLVGGYLARVDDLPGCLCRGDSEVAAVENARAAIRAWRVLARSLEDRPAIVEIEVSA
jgi:predicted RNase H-like HicB family nuclease